MDISLETLKKIIVGSGFVSEQEFDSASKSAQETGKDVIDVLIFRGLINEEAAGKLIAEYFGVDLAKLKSVSIPEELLSLVPEKIARLYRVIPFGKEDGKVKVAMENPNDFEALEFVKRKFGGNIKVYFATHEEFIRALGEYKKGIREDFQEIIEENIKGIGKKEEDLAKLAEEAPVVRIFETILSYAITEKASDVHIEVQEKEVIVRFRVDGVLRDVVKFPRGIEHALVARIKILSNLKIDEHRIPQDGRYKFKQDDEVVSLRISIIPGFYGENVVLRVLQETNRPLSLEELGLTGRNLEIVRENIVKPHGMILVTGPTGSGKTTTLYSVINILNTAEVKICTIEDPIEYGIPRVTQIQVNPKTGLEFSTGLRALLRHDPDIIMIGEIRDKETAEIAIHSALTGHLVLSTLHTNSAAGAIPRFLDMGAEGFLLASTINVVIAQRLVRKICNSCVVKYQPDEAVRKRLSKELGVSLEEQKFYKGKGCNQCNHKGFVGRIGIFEVLPVNDRIRELIVQKATAEEIQKAAEEDKMITMLQDGLDKVSSGLTTIEEVLRVVRES